MRVVATAFVALLALSVGALGRAQDAPPPWMQLNVLEVEPSMVDEFVDLQRQFSEQSKKAKVPWRTVSRTEVFGDTYRYYVARPFESFAALSRESQNPETGALVERLRRYITSRQSFAVHNLQDVSDPLPAGERPDLMIVNFAYVAPGREQEYLDVMTEDFFPHFKEAGVHHVTGAIAFGGQSGFVHVYYVKDFAELDKGSPVMQALGPAGALEVAAKLSGIVTSSESSLVRLIPEASYGPEPKKDTDSDSDAGR